MKRLIKRALKPIWRLTAPVRRPILRKLDARLHAMIAASIRAEILPAVESSLGASSRSMERLEASINAANHTARTMACDMDLMLGSVIRELARLQAQLDGIEEALGRGDDHGRAGLTLVEADDDGPFARRADSERSKVG